MDWNKDARELSICARSLQANFNKGCKDNGKGFKTLNTTTRIDQLKQQRFCHTTTNFTISDHDAVQFPGNLGAAR